MKTGDCERCGEPYQWRFKTGGFCTPCARLNKAEYMKDYKKARSTAKRKRAEPSVDHLPPVDWVMELQFKTFFDLIDVRYKCQKDVSQTINMNAHKKPYRHAQRM